MEVKKGLNKSLFIGFLSTLSLIACGPQKNHTAYQMETAAKDSGIIAGTAVSNQDALSKSIVGIFATHQAGDTGGAICTGSLLPGNIVLTAAHCVDNFMVVVFSQDFNSTQSNQVFQVDKIAVSPYWETRKNASKDHGDIAILHFQGNVPAGYVPANLVTDASVLENQAQVVLAGYGVNHVAETPIDVNTYPDLIKSVQTGKVVCDDPTNLKNCAQVDMTGSGLLRKTSVTIEDNKFAQSEILLNQTKGTGACHGDSGGPAYITVNGQLYLWGVTSRGERDPKNDCSQYAVYTSTLFYKDWITQVSNRMNSVVTDNSSDVNPPSMPNSKKKRRR